MTLVLVAGVPRGGTTWLAELLAANPEVGVVHEPDNQWTKAFAFRAKQDLPGRVHPALRQGDSAAEFQRLWEAATGTGRGGAAGGPVRAAASRLAERLFAGVPTEAKQRAFMSGRIPPRLALGDSLAAPRPTRDASPHRVLRSVFASLCVEWVVDLTGAAPVIVLRHSFNVLGGWKSRGWLDVEPQYDLLSEIDGRTLERLSDAAGSSPPSLTAPGLVRAAYLLGLLQRELRDAHARHPDWAIVRHEDLCVAPREGVRALAGSLGLPWSARNEDAIAALDRPTGPLEIHRRTRDLPRVWRERLTEDDARLIESVLEGMGLGDLAADPPT
jgi:hypothetical protein